MAEFLITGLEMPKDDILRIEICPNGQVNRIVGWAVSEQNKGRAKELPPHGRLGDIDKMELDFKATVVNCIEKDMNRAYQYKVAERLVLGILKRTHSVIPASEETD